MNTQIVRGIRAVKANLDPKAVIADMQSAFQDFVARNDGKVSAIEAQLNAIETAVARGQLPGGGGNLKAVTAEKKQHEMAFNSWFRSGIDANLKTLEIQAGLRTNSDPDGGYLVPETLDKNIDRIASQSVAMRRLAYSVTIEQGEYKRPISQGGSVAGWVGETDERLETAGPGLAMFAPPWTEVYCQPEVTQKLLDLAAFPVAQWVTDEISLAELELEGAAFISGNGVGQPKGFLAYDMVANPSWSFGKVGFITSGNAATIPDHDKLIDLQHSLKAAYRQNASWLMADATWSVIRKFKDGEGNYLWRPGLEKGAPDMLLGKPVEIDDNMPVIAGNAFPIAFADWKRAYTIGNHVAGRRLLRDDLTKKGWVKFYVSKRVFGGLHNTEAIKLLKISA